MSYQSMKHNMNNYKLKENLFLIGKKVISYETWVATIKDGKIYERGRYSRTTSKHINYVSELTGSPIERSNEKKRHTFYKYEIGGAKFNIEGAIPPKVSKKILLGMKEGIAYVVVISSIKNKIRKKDWELIYKPKTLTKELVKGSSLLSRMNLI